MFTLDRRNGCLFSSSEMPKLTTLVMLTSQKFNEILTEQKKNYGKFFLTIDDRGT